MAMEIATIVQHLVAAAAGNANCARYALMSGDAAPWKVSVVMVVAGMKVAAYEHHDLLDDGIDGNDALCDCCFDVVVLVADAAAADDDDDCWRTLYGAY